MNQVLELAGCRSDVLGSYLKALAVHRLVAEQVDRASASWWSRDGRFCLRSSLDTNSLVDFFLARYRPTPIVTPWNGGSGFFEGDQQAGIKAIEQSVEPRFSAYREALVASRNLLAGMGLTEKPDKEKKARLLSLARAWLSDAALVWLDAAYAVGEEARYPALLGTGGNDGRLDFANNFMQRLADMLLAPPRGRRKSADPRSQLEVALFASKKGGALETVAAGQFAPGVAGGSNMTAGLEADARVNPWDFIFALEGALVFAGAAVRRFDADQRGSASFPFHVMPAAVGYGSSADADSDTARSEIWLPLWSGPAGYGELRALFAEGRLDVSGRRARDGLDAARAVASLGVDRGIDRFERVGILRRNGLAYLAAHLGAVPVREIRHVDLLRDLEPWLEQLDRMDAPPAAVTSALRRLRRAIFDVCQFEGANDDKPLTRVLEGVGALERAVSRSPKARERVRPAPSLQAEWYRAADDGSTEMAIAAAVASWGIHDLRTRRGSQWNPIRRLLEPVDLAKGIWGEERPDWTHANPLSNIVEMARTRLLDPSPQDQRKTDPSPHQEGVSVAAVPLVGGPFIHGRHLGRLLSAKLDEVRLADLCFAVALLDFVPYPEPGDVGVPTQATAAYCLLRAAVSPRFLAEDGRHPALKQIPAMLTQVLAGKLDGAVTRAVSRLRASGCLLLLEHSAGSRRGWSGRTRFGQGAERTALAAALVLPLPDRLELNLARTVALRPSDLRLEDDKA